MGRKSGLNRILLFRPAFALFILWAWPSPGQEPPKILGLKERAAVYNGWLKVRLEQVLPEIMRREDIDMWVVICREHNEDPVYQTLVPYPNMFAWRLTMFVFHDRGKDGLEYLSVNRYGSGDFNKELGDYYKPSWEPENIDPWQRLAEIIRARNPKKIAINESQTFAFADGLSATDKAYLLKALGPEYSRRLVSAERVVVGWLERRTKEELEVYTQIASLNHQIVAEVFSRKAVRPGATTIDDLSWWTRERIAALNLEAWFQPTFYILRRQTSPWKNSRVIQPGDLLRCDIGITYLSLNTDIQESAYVLTDNETGAPQGLKDALRKGNRLQDILIGEFKERRTGNEILAAALKKAVAEGLKPRIYSHPLGYHGHAAGPRIGQSDMQEGVPGMGDYPLFPDTCFAIELSVRAVIPEWDNQEIQMALEEDAIFTSRGVFFLDGRQTKLYLIR